MNHSVWTRFLLCVLFAVSIASAEDGLRWSLGLGVISSPRPYVGADDELQPIPLLELKYKRLYVEGTRAGYHFLDSRDFQFDLRAQARFAGFDEGDSTFLRGMGDRKETLDGGLALSWKLGSFDLGVDVVGDLLGRSDGIEATTTLTRPKFFADGKVALFPSVGFDWQSEKLVDYYAGVRPNEALPDRPAYAADATLNIDLGLALILRFSEHWRSVAVINGQRLGSAYDDSPIIEDSWGVFGLVGLAYEF